MDQRIERVLIDRRTIAERVEQMARQIADDFRARTDASGEAPTLVLVSIMTGSVIFLADLIRHLPMMIRIKLIAASSYPGKSTASQGVTIANGLPDDLGGQHVLIVDDILDSGRTLSAVRQLITERHPASIGICVLLRKQVPSAMAVKAEYVGFDIPDEFVVGYGLDYDDYYRNLPDVVTLKSEAMK